MRLVEDRVTHNLFERLVIPTGQPPERRIDPGRRAAKTLAIRVFPQFHQHAPNSILQFGLPRDRGERYHAILSARITVIMRMTMPSHTRFPFSS